MPETENKLSLTMRGNPIVNTQVTKSFWVRVLTPSPLSLKSSSKEFMENELSELQFVFDNLLG